jgi:hypothetical protein
MRRPTGPEKGYVNRGCAYAAPNLYCCAGGATRGLEQAGFHVTGIDFAPQPHYCDDEFVLCDAVSVLR